MVTAFGIIIRTWMPPLRPCLIEEGVGTELSYTSDGVEISLASYRTSTHGGMFISGLEEIVLPNSS